MRLRLTSNTIFIFVYVVTGDVIPVNVSLIMGSTYPTVHVVTEDVPRISVTKNWAFEVVAAKPVDFSIASEGFIENFFN